MIVDAHVHVFPPDVIASRESIALVEPYFELLYRDPRRKLRDAGSLIDAMDAAGVEKAFAMNFGWSTPELTRQTNDYLLETAEKFAGRILPLISLPLADVDVSLRELERCLAGRLLGIGELMPDGQGYVDDLGGKIAAIAARAAEHNLLVCIHGSEPVGHAYLGKGSVTPDKLLRLAEEQPTTKFLFAHLGGGLPFYHLMPEVMNAVSNVWYDTAAAPLLYTSRTYAVILKTAGDDRVLFGSDAPLLPYRRVFDHIEAAGLAESEKDALMFGNAETLLRSLGW